VAASDVAVRHAHACNSASPAEYPTAVASPSEPGSVGTESLGGGLRVGVRAAGREAAGEQQAGDERPPGRGRRVDGGSPGKYRGTARLAAQEAP
jgi:hypothetical protein